VAGEAGTLNTAPLHQKQNFIKHFAMSHLHLITLFMTFTVASTNGMPNSANLKLTITEWQFKYKLRQQTWQRK